MRVLRTAPNVDRVSDLIYRLESEEGTKRVDGGSVEDKRRRRKERERGVHANGKANAGRKQTWLHTHAVVIWALSLSLLIDLI